MNSNFSENIQQEIEAYIKQQMSLEDKTSFEARMEQDAFLKEEVQLQKSLSIVLNENDWELIKNEKTNEDLNKLKEKLKSQAFQKTTKSIKNVEELYFKGSKKESSIKYAFYFKLAVAAIIIALISIPFLINNESFSLSSNYKELAQWNDIPSFIEKSENKNEEIIGETLFKTKQYPETISYFEALKKEKNKLHPYSLMYLGASYLQENNTDDALTTFDELINTNSIESSRGHWYKLLVYLKLEQLEKVKETLSIILSDKNNYNYKEAKALFEQLNQFPEFKK